MMADREGFVIIDEAPAVGMCFWQEKKVFDGTPREVFSHYKELEAMGLAAPQVTYLVHDLKAQGIAIDESITTVEEAREAILTLWRNQTKEGTGKC